MLVGEEDFTLHQETFALVHCIFQAGQSGQEHEGCEGLGPGEYW